MTRKTGPLTQEDLAELWKSVVDPGYSRPFIEQGEGHGYEAYTQGFAQMVRASQAVDRSFSALYVEPFSGQTNLPASGARKATVDLSFTRSLAFAEVVVLDVQVVAIEEQATDFGPNGGEPVLTGRRYRLVQPCVFVPGAPGPLAIHAEAEAPGFGYSNPLPGTITSFVQPGKDFTNNRASIVPGVSAHRLAVRPDPDVCIPEHIGQYVELVAGSNAGQRRRVIGYESPTIDTHPPTGGTLLLAPTTVLRFSLIAGTFTPGEMLEQATTGAQLRVLAQSGTTAGGLLIADRTLGNIALGQLCYGVLSGAVCVFDAVELSPTMMAEAGTATWRILDWEIDFGISVTNELSPEGGASAILDEIGDERGVQRRAGEVGTAGDETYRVRVGALADVVSPNALSRAANRILSPYGEAALLREVGYPLFRGFFLDGDPDSTDPDIAFAWDLDELQVGGAAFIGQFIEGEKVTQTVDGVTATGRACVEYTVPGGTLPAPLGFGFLDGVAGIEGTFVDGPDIVGEMSGAVVEGTVFTGGLRTRDRWKTLLSYTEFRAFFLMGTAKTGLGDFGFAFDAGPFDAFDSSPYLTFFDGFPLTEASLQRGIWNALNAARAGGVGFTIVRET